MNRVLAIALLVLNLPLATGQPVQMDLLRAEAMLSSDKLSGVLEVCDMALLVKPDYRLFLLRGEAYLNSGDIQNAKKDFISANTLEESSGLLGMARSEARSGNTKGAIEFLEKHMVSDFKISEKDLMLDKNFAPIENTPEWKNFLKREWYNALEQGIAEIEYLLREENIDEAIENYTYLRGLYSEKPEIFYIAGIIDLKRGDYSRASENILKSISEGYNNLEVTTAYINSLLKGQNYSSVLEFLNHAMMNFPGRAELLIIRAESKRKSGDREGAMDDLETYLEIFPNDVTAINLAGSVAFENRNYSNALKYFSANIENDPGNAVRYNERANVHLVTKNWNYAISDYSMALDLDPYNADTYYNKGLSLIEKGDVDDACHDFRQALKLGNRKASSMIGKYCIK